jgi:surface protein
LQLTIDLNKSKPNSFPNYQFSIPIIGINYENMLVEWGDGITWYTNDFRKNGISYTYSGPNPVDKPYTIKVNANMSISELKVNANILIPVTNINNPNLSLSSIDNSGSDWKHPECLISVDSWIITDNQKIYFSNFSNAFSNCINLKSVPNTLPPKATNLSNMFANAFNFNYDISGWDVSNVTDMSYMFKNAQRFNQPISKWNVTSSLQNIKNMFDTAIQFIQNKYTICTKYNK